MKVCTVCKIAQPIEAFNRHRRLPDGRASNCKSCDAARKRLQEAKYRENQAAVQAAMAGKTCSDCRCTFLLSNFAKSLSAKDGLQHRCRQCQKARYHQNKERELKRSAERYARNKEQIKARQKQQRIDHPEIRRAIEAKWKAANKEKAKAVLARHYINNRARYRAQEAVRRAKLLKATPAWADLRKIAEFYKAAEFLGMVTGEWYEVDHIVPLNSKLVCGLHWEGNLQILSRGANRRKSNRVWPDMPAQVGTEEKCLHELAIDI